MNYWDTSTEEPIASSLPPKPKKKVKFGDILEHMNIQVDRNGVLKYMSCSTPLNDFDDAIEGQEYDHATSSSPAPAPTPAPTRHRPVPATQHQNSYIYNKYFKDYTAKQPEMSHHAPQTLEEYYQLQQKAREERERIRQIKSTKLLFTTTTPTGEALRPPPVIRPSQPHHPFRTMSFK